MKKLIEIVVVLSLVVVGDHLVSGQQLCYSQTACEGHYSGRTQATQLQGPPGKQGPNGPVGGKGEKGEAGKFYSDADELEQLKTKFRIMEDQLKTTNNLLSETRKILSSEGSELCPVGIADRSIITNNQMSASSYHSSSYLPHYGRLHSTAGQGSWASKTAVVGEWIQVDLEKNMRITGIATQGCFLHSREYAATFKINYKLDGQQSFKEITDDEGNLKIFIGNTDHNSVVKNTFDNAVTARYFRVLPLTWLQFGTLRFELYTC